MQQVYDTAAPVDPLADPNFSAQPQKSSMPHRRITIAVAVIVVLIAVAVVYVVNYRHGAPAAATATTRKTAPAQVRITASGFTPATISVKIGQDVDWINGDSQPHEVASDPYPTDDTLPGLNSRQPIAAGDSYNYIFKTAGTYTYHDNLHPAMTGTITVK